MNSKLLFVFEHCRHGARSPSSGVNAEHIDYMKQKWDIKGELTGVGMRMHYLLGYINHYKYNNFLTSSADPREILIFSTDLNRTIQSVLAQIQGLYPLSTGPKLSPTQINNAFPPNDLNDEIYKPIIEQLKENALPYQINTIPIQIFNPQDKIYILYEPYKTSKCKIIDSIRKENENKDKMIQIRKDFNTTYGDQLLKFYNQLDPNYIMNTNLVILCDHFLVNLFEKRDLTDLKQLGIDLQQLKNSCENLLNNLFYEVVFGDKDRNVALLSMSSSMKQILHYMKKRIELNKLGNSDKLDYAAPKMLIHSGHDSSVSGMQMFMQKAFRTKTINPVFADNMYLELKIKDKELKGDMSDYYVDYYIRDELIKTIAFDKYETTINDMLWDTKKINQYCLNQKDVKVIDLFCIIVGLVIICGLLIIAIVLSLCALNTKQQGMKVNTSVVNNKISINNDNIY